MFHGIKLPVHLQVIQDMKQAAAAAGGAEGKEGKCN